MNKISINISSMFSSQLPYIHALFSETNPKLGRGKLDKLYLRVPSMNEGFLKNQCRYLRYIRNSGGKQYEYDGKRFMVFAYADEYKIEINPSHFNSFLSFTQFCQKLFFELSKARITRIDCAVQFDSEMYPVDLFYYCCYVPRKTLSSDYAIDIEKNNKSGFLTGFDIGKYPCRISCYDEDTKSKPLCCDDLSSLTNFEIQLSKGNKADFIVNRLDKLATVLKKNPFEDVSFKNVFSLVRKDLNPKIRKRLLQFQRLTYARGYHNARGYIRNTAGNFERDYDPYFPELCIGPDQRSFKDFLLESFYQGVYEWLNK